jgi:hypothetical protein
MAATERRQAEPDAPEQQDRLVGMTVAAVGIGYRPSTA